MAVPCFWPLAGVLHCSLVFFSRSRVSGTGVSMARKFSTTAKPIEHPTRIHATYERFLLERNVCNLHIVSSFLFCWPGAFVLFSLASVMDGLYVCLLSNLLRRSPCKKSSTDFDWILSIYFKSDCRFLLPLPYIMTAICVNKIWLGVFSHQKE